MEIESNLFSTSSPLASSVTQMFSPFGPTISNLLAKMNDTDDDIDSFNGMPTLTNVTSSIDPEITNVTTGTSFLLNIWWLEKQNICDQIDSILRMISEMNLFVLILFTMGIVIAIGGIIAIICQLISWSRRRRNQKERELRYDTERWLDYSFSREKLTPVELSHLRKSTLWQNSVSPISYKNGSSTFAVDSLFLENSKPFCMDINRNITNSKDDTKHKSKGNNNNNNNNNQKEVKTKRLGKGTLTKCLAITSSYDLNDKYTQKEDNNSMIKLNKQKKLKKKKMKIKKGTIDLTSLQYDKNEMSMPLYYNSLSSGTTKSAHSQQLIGVGNVPSLQRKEYEIQTLEIDLTGSDEEDVGQDKNNSKSNEEKTYEKLQNVLKKQSAGNVIYARPKKLMINNASIMPASLPSISVNKSMANVTTSNIATAIANVRQRQQVPPNVIISSLQSNCEFQPRREEGSYSTATSFTSSASSRPLSKNPLYNESSEFDELIMFDSLKKSANALSSSFKQNPNYNQMAPGANKEPVIYSTFIKPS